jgi:hypothetical protein
MVLGCCRSPPVGEEELGWTLYVMPACVQPHPSFFAFSPFCSLSSSWSASSLRLQSALSPSSSSRLRPCSAALPRQSGAIGSHDIRGEVEVNALVDDLKAYGHAELEKVVDNAAELADRGCGWRSANFGYGNSDGLAFDEHEVFGDTSESGGEIVSGGRQRDGQDRKKEVGIEQGGKDGARRWDGTKR